MEEKTTVVIDIQLDANKVADRLSQVNAEMAALRNENAKMRKEVKDGNKTWRDVSVQLADNEAKLKSLKAEQSALSGQVAQATQKNRAYGTSLKEQSAQLNELRDRYKSLTKEERESAQGQEMLRHIQDLDAALKEADYSQGQFQRNVGNYPDAVKPVTAQLREMTQELIRLRMEGKQNTAEYNELLQKTGEMKDAMEDAQRSVKGMASDTAALNSVLDGAKAAAGAFSVALGVMNLVGDKDSKTAKELAEAQAKLQSAIAITTGLQAVQNALQKESALMMGVARLRMLAAAAAQRVYAAATRDATAAQEVFNKVAKSNVYIWLAGVVLSLVGTIAAFTRGSKEQEEQITKVNAELQTQAAVLKELTDAYSEMDDKIFETVQNNIDRRKAEGASVEEIRYLEDQLYEVREEALKREKERIAEEIVKYGLYYQEYRKGLDMMARLDRERITALRRGDIERAQFYQNEIEDLKRSTAAYKQHIDIVDNYYKRRSKLAEDRQKTQQEREAEERQQAEERKRRWQEQLARMKTEREEMVKSYKTMLDNIPDIIELTDNQTEANKRLAESIQKVADHVGLFNEEIKTLAAPDSLQTFEAMSDTMEDRTSKFELFAESYRDNAEAIQETSSALESSFSSLASMYKTMAQDESKTEEEREAAARKAKAWSKIQIAANAGTAVAKGVASAVDVGFPAAIPAMATMLAAILSAIAQAKALASDTSGYETGGVIGGYKGATMGRDNTVASVRTGEMVINAKQQKTLFDIANGGTNTSLAASLAEALRAMPAPVLVYSELQEFGNTVNILDNNARLK